MARKWQKVATLGRRRIMSTRTNVGDNKDEYSPSIARRGHIFVYSTDGKRFMIPIAYVTNSLFRELFRMSEEEFGLPSDGPITMPCDASYMDYIISILKHGASIDEEKDVLMSIAGCRCSTSFPPRQHDHQRFILYGF